MSSVYLFFSNLFEILNSNENHVVIMTVFVCLHVLAALLRIITCTAYRTALLVFRMESKEIKSKDEIKKIKNAPLRKITADYIRTADKSVSRIPAKAMVDRQVESMSLIGWRYVSVMPFAESLESGLVLVGLILAFAFPGYAFLYGTIAVAGFVLLKIIGAVFDFRSVKDIYSDELLIYVEREIGHFYAADAGGAVLRLKNELSDALAKQAETLKDSVNKIGANMAEAVDKKFAGLGDGLRETAGGWEKAIGEAKKLQEQINSSAEKMQNAGSNLSSASDLLSRHLQGHSKALTEQLSALVSAVETVKESGEKSAATQEAFLSQSKYVEENQRLLETTVQSYESALQNMTRSLGDGIGAFLQLNAQNAAASMNESLSNNIERIAASNREVMQSMQLLFEQLRSQSRDISANLLTLHEKISEKKPGTA